MSGLFLLISIIITGLFLSHPYKVLSTTFKLQRENERIKFIFSLSPFRYSRYILFRHTIFFCLPLPPYFRLPPSLTPCVSLFYIISINFLSKWCELTALLIKRMKGKTSKLILNYYQDIRKESKFFDSLPMFKRLTRSAPAGHFWPAVVSPLWRPAGQKWPVIIAHFNCPAL